MITKDSEETIVIFRKWKASEDIVGGDRIIALFPEIEEGWGRCLSYEHIGQHGGADYLGCLPRTIPAKPEEYAPLKAELEGLGYNLLIRRRR